MDALDRHWERARIEAHRETDGSYTISAENVKAFTIDLPSGETAGPVKVKIGVQHVETTATAGENKR